MTSSVAIRIRNEPSELTKARDKLDQLGREYLIPERDLIALQVALDEIASNVIKYSWSDGDNHEFLIRISLDSDAVTLQITDDGPPFDPRRAPAPTSRSKVDRVARPGGAGIHLIRNLVDGFDYRRVRGHNQTTLIKKIGAAAAQGKDRS